MQKRISHYYTVLLNWVRRNIWRIIFILVVHGAITFLLRLPYINLIRTVIGFATILVDFILVLVIFRPEKKYLLYLGLATFPLMAVFSLVHINSLVELLGNFSYLFILSYILLSLREI